jgi:hypothetical protein
MLSQGGILILAILLTSSWSAFSGWERVDLPSRKF